MQENSSTGFSELDRMKTFSQLVITHEKIQTRGQLAWTQSDVKLFVSLEQKEAQVKENYFEIITPRDISKHGFKVQRWRLIQGHIPVKIDDLYLKDGGVIPESEIFEQRLVDEPTLDDLAFVADRGNLKAVKALFQFPSIQEACKKNSNAYRVLYAALSSDDNGILQYFLEKGLDPNSASSNYHWTCLHMAALSNFTGNIRTLMTFGAISSKGKNGDTPLHHAVIEGHIEATQLLLQYETVQSMLDHADDFGAFPLHLAVHFDKKEMAAMLLCAGADVGLLSEDDRKKLESWEIRPVFAGRRKTVG